MKRFRWDVQLLTMCISLTVGNICRADQPSSGTFIAIDVPGASSTGAAPAIFRFKINPEGQIVGGYLDAIGHSHGFLLTNGAFTTIDFPGAIATQLSDIK